MRRALVLFLFVICLPNSIWANPKSDAIKKRLSYLTEFAEVGWVQVSEDLTILIGWNKITEDFSMMNRAAAVHASKVGGSVDVISVRASEKNWKRGSDKSVLCRTLAIAGKVTASTCK